jgi:ATP-binding cassette subfamily B multidrug efflux pump
MTRKKMQLDFMKSALRTVWKDHYGFFLVLGLTVGMSSVVSVWPSFMLRKIVDGPLTGGEGALWPLAFIYLIAILSIGFIDVLREMSATVIGQRMLLTLRQQMLKHLEDLPMSYYLKVPIGETLSKFSADLDAVNTLFSAGLVSAVADLFKIAGLFVALITLSRPLGLLALFTLPIILFLSNFFRRNIFKKQKVVRKKVAQINTLIQEVYSGIKVIKVFGKEMTFSRRFEEKLEAHRLAMNGNSIYDAWFPCVMQVVRAGVIASALVLGASNNGSVFALGLSIGTLAAVADLFVRMFEPIEAVASEIQTIQQAFAGLERLVDFLDEPVENRYEYSDNPMKDSWDPKDLDIVLEDVVFEYTRGKPVINRAFLVIKSGTKVALAGRTGSGKTTLMSLIAGLYPPLSGSLTIGGVNPFTLRPDQRRKLIGIVPQTVQLFNGSIKDNITLHDDTITESAVWDAVKRVGLEEVVSKLEEGILTMLGEGELQLSHGQTQLLSLARAIVTNPPLLLLDELTSGLDTLTEKTLLHAIRDVSRHRTILTISHRLSGIIDAEVVHIMDSGRIMESGEPHALAEKEGWYTIYKRLEALGWQIN